MYERIEIDHDASAKPVVRWRKLNPQASRPILPVASPRFRRRRGSSVQLHRIRIRISRVFGSQPTTLIGVTIPRPRTSPPAPPVAAPDRRGHITTLSKHVMSWVRRRTYRNASPA